MPAAQRYTKEDWHRLAAEQTAIYGEAFRLLQAGLAPGSVEAVAVAVAERHRESIERWFYPCSHALHCKLADVYEQDSRFTRNLDKYGPNLTPFLAQAIRQNAERRGDDSDPRSADPGRS